MKIISTFKKYKLIGVVGIIDCFLHRIRLFILMNVYKFDSWHVKAPYECRPYKKEVVEFINSLELDSIVEVGSGLGDIISRINVVNKWGFDIDPRAVKVSNLLYGDKAFFYCASLDDVDVITRVIDGKAVDLIFMINWPHTLEWRHLSDLITQILTGLSAKYLLIDGIKDEVTGYANKHTACQLSEVGEILKIIDSVDGVRRFFLIDCSKLRM